jgi:hypothetical protein
VRKRGSHLVADCLAGDRRYHALQRDERDAGRRVQVCVGC